MIHSRKITKKREIFTKIRRINVKFIVLKMYYLYNIDMFYRKINEALKRWKDNEDRVPLIIKGLRQVGKTTTVLEFAKSNYENIIYIDFRSDTIYKSVFDEDLIVERIILRLKTINPSFNFTPYKTVIIFDELQECARARASLKYFSLDKRFDVIATGSLLGIKNYNLDFEKSVSVGFEYFIDMFPMDFEEFLLALNYGELNNALKSFFEEKREISGVFHELALQLFRQYLVVGGMPQAIKTYIKTKNLYNVFEVQKSLLTSFEMDFGRYINEKNLVLKDSDLFNKILEVYHSIPYQLAKENKKFQLSKINHNARMREYQKSIDRLNDSGLVYRVNNLSQVETPLISYTLDESFKLYFSDVGLLLSMYDYGIQNEVLSGNSGVYKGALYENIILSLLKTNGFNLYYYSKLNRLEVDFVTNINGLPYIIEVKATNSKSKSLSTLMNNKEMYGSNKIKAIKFYDKNINFDYDKEIIYLPYYLASYITLDSPYLF